MSATCAQVVMDVEPVAGRVSVIVPTKNSERTIAACLSSIRRQTYDDIELIVVDNASTDGTVAIASRFVEVILDGGPERSAQRNIGAAQSTGEFLVFIDSDMTMSRTVVECLAREFRRDSDVAALIIPECSVGQGFWARCRALEKEIYVGDPAVEAARAFRRAMFMRLGGYDERIYAGGEDWDLPERLVANGGVIGRIRPFVVHDEGYLRLSEDLAQKFYYGRSFGVYVARHPNRAVGKFLRIGLARRLDVLRREPVHAGGLAGLKVLELVALLAGMVAALFRRHPAERLAHQARGQGINQPRPGGR